MTDYPKHHPPMEIIHARKSHKKLSYRRGTARRAMLVNPCCVSRAMGVKL